MHGVIYVPSTGADTEVECPEMLSDERKIHYLDPTVLLTVWPPTIKMTITSSRYVTAGSSQDRQDRRISPKPIQRIWHAAEPPFKGYQPLPTDGYARSSSGTVIVIDNGWWFFNNYTHTKLILIPGASLLRAGWAFDKSPRISYPATVARYRDRKINRTVSYVGYNAFADATTRGQIRNAFEPGTNVVGNWDVMEGLLDYAFTGLGISAQDEGVGRPILMTEPVANLGYSRKSKSSAWRLLNSR